MTTPGTLLHLTLEIAVPLVVGDHKRNETRHTPQQNSVMAIFCFIVYLRKT